MSTLSPQELISNRDDLTKRFGKTPEETVQTAEDLSMRAEEAMMSFRSNYKVGRLMSKIMQRSEASKQSLEDVQGDMSTTGTNGALYREYVDVLSKDQTAAGLYDSAYSAVSDATAQWTAAGAHCKDTGSYVSSQVGLAERFENAQHNLKEIASGMPTPPGQHSIERRLTGAQNVLQAALRRGPNVVPPAPQMAPTAAPSAAPSAQPRAAQSLQLGQSLEPGGPRG